VSLFGALLIGDVNLIHDFSLHRKAQLHLYEILHAKFWGYSE
jgi:hypothetical protein